MNTVMHYASATQARKIASRKLGRLRHVVEARAVAAGNAVTQEKAIDITGDVDATERVIVCLVDAE